MYCVLVHSILVLLGLNFGTVAKFYFECEFRAVSSEVPFDTFFKKENSQPFHFASGVTLILLS